MTAKWGERHPARRRETHKRAVVTDDVGVEREGVPGGPARVRHVKIEMDTGCVRLGHLNPEEGVAVGW